MTNGVFIIFLYAVCAKAYIIQEYLIIAQASIVIPNTNAVMALPLPIDPIIPGIAIVIAITASIPVMTANASPNTGIKENKPKTNEIIPKTNPIMLNGLPQFLLFVSSIIFSFLNLFFL